MSRGNIAVATAVRVLCRTMDLDDGLAADLPGRRASAVRPAAALPRPSTFDQRPGQSDRRLAARARRAARHVDRCRCASIAALCEIGMLADALPPAARYALVLAFSFSAGVIPASVFSGLPVHARTPQHIGTSNGIVMQASQIGQFLGADRARLGRHPLAAGTPISGCCSLSPPARWPAVSQSAPSRIESSHEKRRADQRSRPARRPAERVKHRCPPRTRCAGSTRSPRPALREIEVGSFVPAKLLPQMADSGRGGAPRAHAAGPHRDGAGAQPARARRPRSRPACTSSPCRSRPAPRIRWPTCARRPSRWSRRCAPSSRCATTRPAA